MNILSNLSDRLTSFKQPLKTKGTICTVFALVLSLGTSSSALGQQDLIQLQPDNPSEILIESDKQSSDSTGSIFTAYGNVKITYPDKGIISNSRQAQYIKDEGILVLTGDVALIRNGGNSLHGERVVYFLNDDQLVVDSYPGSQVLLKLSLGSEHIEGQSSLL